MFPFSSVSDDIFLVLFHLLLFYLCSVLSFKISFSVSCRCWLNRPSTGWFMLCTQLNTIRLLYIMCTIFYCVALIVYLKLCGQCGTKEMLSPDVWSIWTSAAIHWRNNLSDLGKKKYLIAGLITSWMLVSSSTIKYATFSAHALLLWHRRIE